jgi:hypothetical protein
LSRLCSAILLCTSLVWARPVHAAAVVIVRPASSPFDMTEVLSRLRGELLSVGLEVAVVDRADTRGPTATDSLAWLQRLTAERGVSAVIDIVGDDALIAVDVWIVKEPPRRFEVTRVAVEPDAANQSGRLALRAVEALRGSLLRANPVAQERRNEAITEPVKAAPPQSETGEPESHRSRLGLELGAAALMSLDGVGPAFLPTIRVGWLARSWFVVQAALAGLGSRPTVETRLGKAEVGQRYGVLGGRLLLRADKRFSPFLALAAGVLRTEIQGSSGAGTEGHNVTKWSFLLDGSMGVALNLRPRYYLTLAGHVQAAEPYVAIHFADTIGATTGRPNVLLTLTVGTWL